MATIRMWVPKRKDRAHLRLTSPVIKWNSVVHISVSEATELEPNQLFGQNFPTVFGAASITVQNISVRDGVVDFNVFVDWSTPLNIVTDITILEPPADGNIIIGT
ncbi:hypothetical protein COM24_29970 [Bacillus toyonensis]|nr:hypothetical protein [Bacillus toyonensis]KXY43671.1 hypothetical protein AT265_00205 [Bacillus cereus]PEE30860.1 hypothetical protein CON98_06985 [Bacillus toyonensis]PEL01156.1 hypothetical protein CN606_18615 [Bacillus toyonensis]PEO22377.1 hypothetical protein CN589_32070 [Bacillus toyonensis]PFX36666.1 hypothetical protein COL24_26610 [Bacillus toyonensis]